MPFGAALMSPRRLGLRRSTFTYIKDTLEMAPTAYRPGPLLKPQATEPGWNGKADQRRTIGSAIALDSTRRLIQRLVQRFRFAGHSPPTIHVGVD
jgi:hypothetical protein